MKITEKLLMYISSYAPLYFLLIIKEYDKLKESIKNIKKDGLCHSLNVSETWFFIFIFICILLSVYIMIKVIFSKSTRSVKIIDGIENSGDSIISYIMTYIVPMLSIDSNDNKSLLLNLILFCIIGILYISNDLLYLNPLLSLLGFRYYLTPSDQLVISRMKISELNSARANGNQVYIYEMTDNISIYKKIRK
ncbi:hypothetical protein [Vagococcus lutrae]|uniref:hypothetical protein n=1 Tax=Vagococcus lutrae TaxID=81947 RepID=UPI00200BA637|nr:hypothetical protein [Vagococcus lutrae]UQF12385.1 hypothetical protein M2919_03440 [Vagococcus lutrae]